MGMHRAESGQFANRSDPAVGRAPVESRAVVADKDRAGGPLTDGEVDGPGSSGNEGDDRRFVALTNDPQYSVTSLHTEVFDVDRACLARPQRVQPEEHRQGGMGVVEALGGEQERPELATVQASGLARMDLGAAHILGRVRGDPSVDVGEAVEAAYRR